MRSWARRESSRNSTRSTTSSTTGSIENGSCPSGPDRHTASARLVAGKRAAVEQKDGCSS
jgi:hypothetical protein